MSEKHKTESKLSGIATDSPTLVELDGNLHLLIHPREKGKTRQKCDLIQKQGEIKKGDMK